MTRLVVALIVALTALVLGDEARAQKQPNVSDIATCNKEAQAAAGSPSALPRGPGAPEVGGSTDSTGQLVTDPPDPRLEGMSAARAGDAAFREAYRACMRRLGY